MQRDVDLPDSHAFLDICRTHTLAQVDNELGDLLHVDHIFALVRVLLILNDLSAACYLQWLLLCHSLPVGGDIPKVWRCKTGVGFLGTCELGDQGLQHNSIDNHLHTDLLIDAVLLVLDILLELLESSRVWGGAIGL